MQRASNSTEAVQVRSGIATSTTPNSVANVPLDIAVPDGVFVRTYQFQAQLVASTNRSGNYSLLQDFDCSAAEAISKSIMGVVMCVAMAIVMAAFF